MATRFHQNFSKIYWKFPAKRLGDKNWLTDANFVGISMQQSHQRLVEDKMLAPNSIKIWEKFPLMASESDTETKVVPSLKLQTQIQ